MTFGLPQPRMAGSRFADVRPVIVPAIDRDAPITAKNKLWSISEIAVLREHADRGIRHLERMLPNRSRSAIQQAVRRYGLRLKRVGRPPGYKRMEIRGHTTLGRHLNPFVKRLVAELNRQKMTLTELDAKAGLGNGTVRSWRDKTPRLDTFTAAANALGLDLRIEPLSTVKD